MFSYQVVQTLSFYQGESLFSLRDMKIFFPQISMKIKISYDVSSQSVRGVTILPIYSLHFPWVTLSCLLSSSLSLRVFFHKPRPRRSCHTQILCSCLFMISFANKTLNPIIMNKIYELNQYLLFLTISDSLPISRQLCQSHMIEHLQTFSVSTCSYIRRLIKLCLIYSGLQLVKKS